jgi:hypothetical protein
MLPSYNESRMEMLPQTIDEEKACELDDLVQSSESLNGESYRGCRHCSGVRKRRGMERWKFIMITLAVLLMLFLLVAAVAYCCRAEHVWALSKRQQGGYNGNAGDNGSNFNNDHLWIIIVCVVGTVQL